MYRLYLDLFSFLPLAPPVLAALGTLVYLRLPQHRWVVHAVTSLAMVFAFPCYVYFLGVLDPSSIQYPGPGDAFIWMAYLVVLLPTALVYWLVSSFTRNRLTQ